MTSSLPVNTARSSTLPRSDVQGVQNFAQISAGLYRGAQPTREGFESLRAMGIKTIINLRAYHTDRRRVGGLGLGYIHLYCRAWIPRDRHVGAFLKILSDPKNHPVFVHCLHGADRTGCMVAAYRMVEQGWDKVQAAGELKHFGHHKMFPQIRRYLRRFDEARVKERIARLGKLDIRKM
jgi:protein tyrosine/serine phosphatase